MGAEHLCATRTANQRRARRWRRGRATPVAFAAVSSIVVGTRCCCSSSCGRRSSGVRCGTPAVIIRAQAHVVAFVEQEGEQGSVTTASGCLQGRVTARATHRRIRSAGQQKFGGSVVTGSGCKQQTRRVIF